MEEKTADFWNTEFAAITANQAAVTAYLHALQKDEMKSLLAFVIAQSVQTAVGAAIAEHCLECWAKDCSDWFWDLRSMAMEGAWRGNSTTT
jgi:hypothetical protein